MPESRMHRPPLVLPPLCVAAVCCLLIASAARAGRMEMGYFEELYKLKRIFEIIEHQYVDEEKVDREKMLQGAIEGAIKTLDDPYTRFMPPRNFSSMQTETSGEYGGLGMVISIRDDVLTVVAPMPGTPAYRAGIRAGDKIVAVNGKSTKGMTIRDAVNLLRGPVGTSVELSIMREGLEAPVRYKLVRARIKVSSVTAKVIDGRIAYLQLSGFIQTTGADVEKALKRFMKKYRLQGCILDLRNNPGGLLNAAVEVGRIFIGKGVIVSTRSRTGAPVVYSSYSEALTDLPVVVLINRGSASASEIVAGAMKDHRRAVLVGERSFGKGCVQSVVQLVDHSALALTTAYYYTPSGVCIHEMGIAPDIEVHLPPLTDEMLKELRSRREKMLADVDNDAMTVSRYDTQLMTAVQILEGTMKFKSRWRKAAAGKSSASAAAAGGGGR